jgi:hypothetical protein
MREGTGAVCWGTRSPLKASVITFLMVILYLLAPYFLRASGRGVKRHEKTVERMMTPEQQPELHRRKLRDQADIPGSFFPGAAERNHRARRGIRV